MPEPTCSEVGIEVVNRIFDLVREQFGAEVAHEYQRSLRKNMKHAGISGWNAVLYLMTVERGLIAARRTWK